MSELSRDDLEAAVRAAWALDACDPADAAEWSSASPARGQCGPTALTVQDLLGGDLLIADVLRTDGSRQGVHYWNLLPDGTELDLTRQQFASNEVIQEPRISSAPQGCRSVRPRRDNLQASRRLFPRLAADSMAADDDGRGVPADESGRRAQPIPALCRRRRAASSRWAPPRRWGPSPCSRRSPLPRPPGAATARGRLVRTAASSGTDTGHRRLPQAVRRLPGGRQARAARGRGRAAQPRCCPGLRSPRALPLRVRRVPGSRRPGARHGVGLVVRRHAKQLCLRTGRDESSSGPSMVIYGV